MRLSSWVREAAARIRAALVRVRVRLRDPATLGLVAVLAGAAALRVTGIGWGLPASEGWDNDGIAPRDFLAGLVETFTPGHFYTYPPIHVLLLALLTAPVSIAALVHAPSLTADGVIPEIIKVPYMTVIAIVARLVTLAMSLGIVGEVAKLAAGIGGRRAGVAAALFCAVQGALTYYAHTSNLDVPYLFWGVLAIRELSRVASGEGRRLRAATAFAVLAVGTKDQAYALFVMPFAFTVGARVLAARGAQRRAILRDHAIVLLAGVASIGAVDGLAYNPRGFVARLRYLVGSASQGYVNYADDWRGRVQVLRDLLELGDQRVSLAFTALALFGIAVALARPLAAPDRDGGDGADHTPAHDGHSGEGTVSSAAVRFPRLVAALPLLALLSFSLFFNCVARRVEHRFTLPQAVLGCVYAGVAADRCLRLRRRLSRVVASAWPAIALAQGVVVSLNVDRHLLFDPRYAVERWLGAHVDGDDTIAVYGRNVYLPRLPKEARVVRIGPDPLEGRAPMPGFEEVSAPFVATLALGPRFVVVSDGWVWVYHPPAPEPSDRGVAPMIQELRTDRASVAFFDDLFAERLGYRLAFTGKIDDGIWPRLDIHMSIGKSCYVFERD